MFAVMASEGRRTAEGVADPAAMARLRERLLQDRLRARAKEQLRTPTTSSQMPASSSSSSSSSLQPAKPLGSRWGDVKPASEPSAPLGRSHETDDSRHRHSHHRRKRHRGDDDADGRHRHRRHRDDSDAEGRHHHHRRHRRHRSSHSHRSTDGQDASADTDMRSAASAADGVVMASRTAGDDAVTDGSASRAVAPAATAAAAAAAHLSSPRSGAPGSLATEQRSSELEKEQELRLAEQRARERRAGYGLRLPASMASAPSGPAVTVGPSAAMVASRTSTLARMHETGGRDAKTAELILGKAVDRKSVV